MFLSTFVDFIQYYTIHIKMFLISREIREYWIPQNFLMWENFLFFKNRFWSFVSGHIFPYFGGVVKVTFFDWRPLKRFLLVSPQFEREKLANSEINLLLQILEFCPEIWHVLMILKINTSSRSNFWSISKIFTLRVDFSTDFQTNFKIS